MYIVLVLFLVRNVKVVLVMKDFIKGYLKLFFLWLIFFIKYIFIVILSGINRVGSYFVFLGIVN